jgi:hypothetical protein
MAVVNGHRLNWKRSLPDSRDFPYRALRKLAPVTLPSKTYLRGLYQVENQGDEGSCSAFAAGGAVQFLEKKELAAPGAKGAQIYNSKYFVKVSKHFIYWGERVIEGTTDQDAGASTLRDACTVLTQSGVCRESLWPYKPSTLYMPPSAVAGRDAARHRVAAYYALESERDMKHCLYMGYPWILGFDVPRSFMNIGSDGMWYPQDGEQIVGGHAVLAIGYDDDMQAYLIRNSWGADWGLNGNFYFPYSAMMSGLANDFFTLRYAQTSNP